MLIIIVSALLRCCVSGISRLSDCASSPKDDRYCPRKYQLALVLSGCVTVTNVFLFSGLPHPSQKVILLAPSLPTVLRQPPAFWSLVMVPSCGKWSVGQFPTPGGGLEHYYSLTLYHERSLLSSRVFIVLFGTKDKSNKNCFLEWIGRGSKPGFQFRKRKCYHYSKVTPLHFNSF